LAKFIKYQSSRAFFTPTKESLDGIEMAIRWAEKEVPALIPMYMHELVFHMALHNQGEARKLSFGPLDPRQESPGAAWKLPVRRISGAYYLGWKVRRVRRGVVQLYNDSREAYFIEFGINWRGTGKRVRRPVRKLSLRRTIDFMRTSQAYHRVWVDIYANPRSRHRGRGFYQIVQSPGAHTRWENVSDRQARSAIRGLLLKGEIGQYQKRMRLTPEGWQMRKAAPGGGTYGGRKLGRRLP